MEKSKDAFRTISEVSDLIKLPSHVLRFWESKFKCIKPLNQLRPSKNISLWFTKANQQYIQLAENHKKNIIGMVHGHVHRELFMKLHRDNH